MLCSGRILTLPPIPRHPSWRFTPARSRRPPAISKRRPMAARDADAAASSSSSSVDTAAASDSAEKNPSGLRIQQRIKSAEQGIFGERRENELPDFPSFIPFLPPLTPSNLKMYYATCFSLIGGIIIFGGLLAPTLELKLGLGGTTYADFIRSMHLPMQLSQVDPIVASFSGGAVGVISALMVVEINNVKQQEQKRCKYCLGTGYLACARCSSTGTLVLTEPIATISGSDQPLSPPRTDRCSNCSGSGKEYK
ncbi:hypothetical protein C4D60_Mb11t00210 [Musa balbisiana]|uniref:Uncharacterized protein n=1 Tax=Musa balbisiana TaxID=52838 RepID=A0A4S8J0Q3_MUSBA|nr:hypothetical protein C4D60_Mb11t00210 [Musa balbisiana]